LTCFREPSEQLAGKVEEAPAEKQGGYRGSNGTHRGYETAPPARLFARGDQIADAEGAQQTPVEIRDAFAAKKPRASGAFAHSLARLMREAALAGDTDLTRND
jgi:hypothetical protein